ncbi:hypothetical protein [Endozoicomonas sp.]|uniref:hypothetical protein n=1 Tax=Endozoicomonas sp. TaxID=1892382 RepID=UPI00383A124E
MNPIMFDKDGQIKTNSIILSRELNRSHRRVCSALFWVFKGFIEAGYGERLTENDFKIIKDEHSGIPMIEISELVLHCVLPSITGRKPIRKFTVPLKRINEEKKRISSEIILVVAEIIYH